MSDAGLDPITLRFLRTLPARAQAVMRYVAEQSAYGARRQLMERLPEDLATLKKSLTVARVNGLGKMGHSFLLYADTKLQEVAELRPDTTLIYVKMRPGPVTNRKVAAVLEAFSPWTLDSIPTFPPRKDAVVFYRTVLPTTVARTQKERSDDSPKWRKKLSALGVKTKKPGKNVTRGKAVADVAFESLRYEFGLGGAKSTPHWRPALISLTSGNLTRQIGRRKHVLRSMTDPSYMAWQAPSKSDTTVPASRLKDFHAFQKNLGLRVPQ